MFNITNITGFETDICKTAQNQYSLDCLNKWFCPQISAYVLNYGLGLIIGVLVASWGLWWFLTYGYKAINYDSQDWLPGKPLRVLFGDLRIQETRLFWADFAKDKIIKLLLGFLAVLIWFFRK